MGTRLAGALLALWMLLGLSASLPASTPVGAVYGGAVACDPAVVGCITIPLTVSTLCSASCPTRSSFSYADPLRFWGSNGTSTGACLTSTNGGAAWAGCTTQPFVAEQGREFYAGASDGSVIAIGEGNGPSDRCKIRRSTDNGTIWATVFTDSVRCTRITFEGQNLYCLADGRCELVGLDDVANRYRVLRSGDNGLTWSNEDVGAYPGLGNSAGAAWDGAGGIQPPNATVTSAAKADVAVLDVWSISTAWANIGDCWGPVIYNGIGRAVCSSAAGAYAMRESDGTLLAALTFPGANASADNGGVSFSFATNNLYSWIGIGGNTGVYVSRDALVSFVQIGTVTGSARGGNAFLANGCIYFTATSTPKFGRVC